MPVKKSKATLDEESLAVAHILKATSFSAHLRCGPFEKYTTRDIPTAREALAEADRLAEAHSRFGRGAIAYAIDKLNVSIPITLDLVEQAEAINADRP